MTFKPDKTENKSEIGYKTLYITNELRDKVLAIAARNDTSFNNVVISMIKHCVIHDEE